MADRGGTRLLQILIVEASHLIWVIRCKRTIQNKQYMELQLEQRWNIAINNCFITDKIITTMIKHNPSLHNLLRPHGKPTYTSFTPKHPPKHKRGF